MKKLTIVMAILALAVIAVDVAVHHVNGGSIHTPATACDREPC